MIFKIRVKQTLQGTRPNERLPIVKCALCAFGELALRFLLFCFHSPIFLL